MVVIKTHWFVSQSLNLPKKQSLIQRSLIQRSLIQRSLIQRSLIQRSLIQIQRKIKLICKTMNYITILIFAIFVVPIATKEYQRDKGMNISVKVINSFICFLLFYSFTSTVRDEVPVLFSS